MVTLNYQVSERWERKKKCLLLLHYDKNPVIACDVFEYRTRYNPLLKEYQFALPFAGKQRVTAFVAQFEKELRELSEQLTREIDARTARYNDSAYLAELKSAYLQKHPAVNSLPPRRRASGISAFANGCTSKLSRHARFSSSTPFSIGLKARPAVTESGC